MASPAGTSSRDALAARVEAAAAALPADARAALALRERDGAGYAQVAAALGIAPADVGARLLGARLAVREAIRGEGEPPHLTGDCRHVRELLCRRQDGEALDDGEAALVGAHVADCSACRATRRALTEATLACRAWVAEPAPLAPRTAPAASGAPRRRRGPALIVAGSLIASVAAVTAIAVGGNPSTNAQDARPAPSPTPRATATPAPAPTPAATPRPDIVPGGGDRFCPPDEPGCG